MDYVFSSKVFPSSPQNRPYFKNNEIVSSYLCEAREHVMTSGVWDGMSPPHSSGFHGEGLLSTPQGGSGMYLTGGSKAGSEHSP